MQLPDRVMIYELYYDDSYDLKHKLKVWSWRVFFQDFQD